MDRPFQPTPANDVRVRSSSVRTWLTEYASGQGLARAEIARLGVNWRYSASVYWTAASLTSIGYGDVIAVGGGCESRNCAQLTAGR